jgi:hypothetical protein
MAIIPVRVNVQYLILKADATLVFHILAGSDRLLPHPYGTGSFGKDPCGEKIA